MLFPPFLANLLSEAGDHNPTGVGQGDFAVNEATPHRAPSDFLPPSQWRSPADTTIVDTPNNLYCKLPQDSPLAVRGARNYPCMGKPGKRAPTVEICDSDKPYEPLAMREHLLGPYPLDPRLVAQGVPPDSRVDSDDHIYAPTEGTPRPPDKSAPPASPAPVTPAPSEPSDADVGPAPTGAAPPPAPPAATGGAVPAAPSALHTNGFVGGPSLAFAQYDPGTGRYVTPDGKTYQRTDLVAAGAPKSWRDLVLGQNS